MSLPHEKKRSSHVGLVFLGLIGAYSALPMCSGTQEYNQNVYNTREDCEQDYSPNQCTSDGTSHFRGPYYRSDPDKRRRDPADPGPGRTYERTNRLPENLVRVQKGIRGGFGSSAHRFGISS